MPFLTDLDGAERGDAGGARLLGAPGGHAADPGAVASLQPTTLACMHGSAWTGDWAGLIRELAARPEMGEPAAARSHSGAELGSPRSREGSDGP